MKRTMAFLICLLLLVAASAIAGFKVKLVKPKKPEQYQARVTAGNVTYAADLLLDGKEQKIFFYKELTPSHVIALRLGVFNEGRTEVLLPLDRLQLLDSAGREVALISPESVAEAVLQGLVVTAEFRDQRPVDVVPVYRDPRTDPTDPRYDPRYDPSRDPRYHPNDPTLRRNPDGSIGPYTRPGVDVVLNPGGSGGSGDLSTIERVLVEKDFVDKAHAMEPIAPSSRRDKFLYFSLPEGCESSEGFILRLPAADGTVPDILLRFQK